MAAGVERTVGVGIRKLVVFTRQGTAATKS